MKEFFVQKFINVFVKKMFEQIKREKKLFEVAEGLKDYVLDYQNGTPPCRKIMVCP